MFHTFELENFGVADAEYLKNLGFLPNDLKGVFHEQVSNGEIEPEANGLIRLL